MAETESMVERVARAICKSKTCEGWACCQWPGNGGKPARMPHCNVEKGGYDDAARAAIGAVHAHLASLPGDTPDSQLISLHVFDAALSEPTP